MQEIKFKREVFEGGRTTEISLIFDYMWTVWLFSTFRNFCFYYNAVFPVQSLLAFSTTPETKGIDAFLLKFVMVKVMALEISFSLLFLNYHVILRSTYNVVKIFTYTVSWQPIKVKRYEQANLEKGEKDKRLSIYFRDIATCFDASKRTL